jgi:hypothetical protein
VYNYAWKTYVEHETGFTDFTLKPLLKARVANTSDTAANKLKAEPCPSKDFRLKERPDLAVNAATPKPVAQGSNYNDGWIQLPKPAGYTHDELRHLLPPMPDGHETRAIYIVNEMCMKACKSEDVESLTRAVNAAREQGLGESIICKSAAALLKRRCQKEPEYHDASEYTGEWQDWVETTGQPYWDKWAARNKDEPMPLLQTNSKESMEHKRAFRNWAVGGISPEGVSIASTLSGASSNHSNSWSELCRDERKTKKKHGPTIEPIIPDTLHTDPASSSSEWQKVDESETLPLKKKHNKIITITNLEEVTVTQQMDKDCAGSKWL